jgi:phospholipid/cholesterol/gamma-HCH transport system substrate-binding protein
MKYQPYQPAFRYVNQTVGTFVLLCLILAGVTLFQSSRVQEWFRPDVTIKVLLPSEGLFGLEQGDAVEILGTTAGRVEQIVIDPKQRMYAEVTINQKFTPFVRVDSKAIIKKRYSVAGDVFMEITRGTGDSVDWKLAVIEAVADKAPTETLQSVLEDLREQVVPTIRDMREGIQSWKRLAEALSNPDGDLAQFVANLNALSEKLDRGEGSLGRLLTDDTLISEAEMLVRNLRVTLDRIGPILEEIQKTTQGLTLLTENLGSETEELPALTRQAKETLGKLSALISNLQKASQDLPRITKGIGDATQNMPALLLQAQETLRELETLIDQLQSSWLVGQSGGEQKEPSRISPTEAGR